MRRILLAGVDAEPIPFVAPVSWAPVTLVPRRRDLLLAGVLLAFAQMHDEELVDYGNEALAQDFFVYIATGLPAPGVTQCLGYGTPLFLGGADELPNLELTTINVYWHLSGQLFLQTKGFPPGTGIDSIRID